MSLHFGAFLGVGPVQPAIGEPGDQTKQCELGLVSAGSAADKAGLQKHDIITKYDGQPITHFEELREHIGHHSPGRVVKIEIQRAGKTLVKEVTLGELR
jgi:C-terminal processing protease CtpA/Prc